ncbi:hypothetical protein M408DRAFT_326021 [Serendipita vermifera MAFF 305830]|uniref:Arrestin-like N-terminal domain-containing protein n=1 Tax=Serendipita vermifera MAFF 305830 TaxID=933852 RepID=A0A0C3BMB9_SERVB|nr:hypothetical protein M408DRAFT_326021 [Serendipita vermifera MAFF 305830]
MSLSISLNPITRSLHMHGTAHTTSSYSLSGTVNLRLSKNTSTFPAPFARTRSAKAIVLTSLMVTFEGKSEHERAGEAYNAVRLCTVSQQLVESPVTLHINDNNHATHYDIVFDLLTIPGWLPPSFNASDNETYLISSTSYSLFATATYRVEGDSQSSSPFGSILHGCLPQRSKEHNAEAERVEIELLRHLVAVPPPRPTETSLFPLTTFSISAQAKDSSPIPNDIVSKLEILCSIPNFVATSESTVPITVKARFKGPLPEGAEQSELSVESMEIDLDQHDHFRSKPDDQYTSRFALPSEQPSTHPLLHRNQWDDSSILGLLLSDSSDRQWTKTKSILSPEAPSSFHLQTTDGSTGAHALRNDWSVIKMNAQLNTAARETISHGSQMGKTCDYITPLMQSPYHRVTHTIRVSAFVTYQGDKQDLVQFSLPVHFIVVPNPPSGDSTLNTDPHVNAPQRISASIPAAQYQPLSLPAYAQLFHDDGEARIDAARGIPPAYKGQLDDSDDVGHKVTKPELVPVGTQLIDLENMRTLLD